MTTKISVAMQDLTANHTFSGGVVGLVGWALIGTTDASGEASVTVTGITSNYDTYALCVSDFHSSLHPNGQRGAIRVGDSGGIDLGSTDYAFTFSQQGDGGDAFNLSVSTGATSIERTGGGADTGEGYGGVYYLHIPQDGTTFPIISGTDAGVNSTPDSYGCFISGFRQAVITVDRVSAGFAAGNVESGRLTVYGIRS